MSVTTLTLLHVNGKWNTLSADNNFVIIKQFLQYRSWIHNYVKTWWAKLDHRHLEKFLKSIRNIYPHLNQKEKPGEHLINKFNYMFFDKIFLTMGLYSPIKMLLPVDVHALLVYFFVVFSGPPAAVFPVSCTSSSCYCLLAALPSMSSADKARRCWGWCSLRQ